MLRSEVQLDVDHFFDFIASKRLQIKIYDFSRCRCEGQVLVNDGNTVLVLVTHLDEEAPRGPDHIWVLDQVDLNFGLRVGSRIFDTLVDDFNGALSLINADIQVGALAKDAPALDPRHVSSRQFEVFWQLDGHDASPFDRDRNFEGDVKGGELLDCRIARLNSANFWVNRE